jgi:iduronate 2-sulfatase
LCEIIILDLGELFICLFCFLLFFPFFLVKTFFRDRMGSDILTLPAYFKAFGYETRGIGKIFHGSLNDAEAWSSNWLPCDRPLYPTQFTHSMKGQSDVKNDNHRHNSDDSSSRSGGGGGSVVVSDDDGNKLLDIHMENTLYDASVGVKVDTPVMGSATLEDDYFRDGYIARTAVSALRELSSSSSSSSQTSITNSDRPLDSEAHQKPFFLAVGFVKPHLPFIAPTK